jgi:hypothetical protein
MHPFQVGQFAQYRVAGLREEAAAARRRVPIRRRAGWILIHVGLRLAVSSAGAARNAT